MEIKMIDRLFCKADADDIITEGINRTGEFNYSVEIETFNYSDELTRYVIENLDTILDEICGDERVMDASIENYEIDMVFAWQHCLDDFQKSVYEYSDKLGYDLCYHDISELCIACSDVNVVMLEEESENHYLELKEEVSI